ncbi:MAG: hypothetical protein IH984_03540 [Planctomycetes bacterium]|nr:hypothetical protein [Planctomycetota bacterium]
MISELETQDSNGASNANPQQLKITACSTRSGRTSLAQVRLENIGIRPIRIIAWHHSWNEGSCVTYRLAEKVHDSLPVVLQERDSHEFLGELECNGSEVTQIGVLDSDGNRWNISAEQVAAFARVAAQHPFPEHLLSDEDRIPEDTSGQDLTIAVRAEKSPRYPHERLAVTIANNSKIPVRIFRAEVKWEYDHHLQLSEESNPIKVEIVEDSVGLLPMNTSEPIPSGGTRECFVDGEFAGILQSAANPNVPAEMIKITLATSRTSGWELTGEGLPEAVMSVARSVATAQARGQI